MARRTLGQWGARHSSTNHMHQKCTLLAVNILYTYLWQTYSTSISCNRLIEDVVVTHHMGSAQSTSSWALGLNASEMRDVPSVRYFQVQSAQITMRHCVQSARRVVPAQRWVPSAQSRVITGPQEPARKKSGWLGRPGRPRRATGLLHFARVIRRFPFGFSLQSSPFRFRRSLFLAVKL